MRVCVSQQPIFPNLLINRAYLNSGLRFWMAYTSFINTDPIPWPQLLELHAGPERIFN